LAAVRETAPGFDVALRDGGTVRIRPVRATDEDALRVFLGELSDNSRWLRFFTAGPDLDAAARLFVGDSGRGLAPLSRVDATEMLEALRTYPLLDGYRGAPRADVPALQDVLVRVAALVAAHRRSPSSTATPCWSHRPAPWSSTRACGSRRRSALGPTRRSTAEAQLSTSTRPCSSA
jgi:hypothetical protein